MALEALEIPPGTLEVLTAIRAAGGRPMVVGGTVRDALLGRAAADWDVEVHGLGEDRLAGALAPWGAKRVGGRFGVFALPDMEIAIPQVGGQHTNPHLPLAEAARRRDFTVNSMAWDPFAGRLFDPFGGVADLGGRRLRHVDDETFVHDPLRVMRAPRFSGQLGFGIEPQTLALCRQLAPRLAVVPWERIRKEWEALLLRGEDMVRAWDDLDASGSTVLFPELKALQGVPQRPDAHPEGDAWIHTGRVLAAAARLREGDRDRDLALMLAAMLHDLGKTDCTRRDALGLWRAIGHEEVSAVRAAGFLERWFPSPSLQRAVLALVRLHGAVYALYRDGAGPRAWARLALAAPDRALLLALAQADAEGAGEKGETPAVAKARAMWGRLAERPPQPWVRGDDLLAMGFSPGPELGRRLREALEMQLGGDYPDRESLLAALRQHPLQGTSNETGNQSPGLSTKK